MKQMRTTLLCAALLAAAASGQQKEIQIAGNQTWIDTGLDVVAGDMLLVEASGQLKYPDAQQPCGPDGLARGWRDMVRVMPLNDQGRGALIGRIGSGDSARPFLVGQRRESRTPVAGRLFLGVNTDKSNAEGSYKVSVQITNRAGDAASAFTGKLPAIGREVLGKIPRRVVDKDGNEGDRVNFLVLGTEEQVRGALNGVGWVVVDRSVKDSILRGVLGTLSREAYLTMPMSELMAFGRSQDFGFAMSDPVRTVASRHHFRLWKAPFDVEGLTLWVGAGTHDIGFDKDQRTGGITHKIDPDTDKEREFIGETLKQSGDVVRTEYVTPSDTVTKAKTAHGEEFTSDGRILVVYLKPTQQPASRFSDVFCSVLAANNPDGAALGPCSRWVQPGGREDLTLGAIPNAYRILVVPGIMNTCVADTPAFETGRKVLTEKYGVTTELLSVPNDSSESNAKVIAEYVAGRMKDDKRKYIVVGYSKGTPDLQVALAQYADLRNSVAAFISVAGASGGSPIADSLPMQLEAWLGKANNKGKCKGDLAQGFKSLKKDVRQRFLESYPHPFVPTYSLASVTTAQAVSKQMKATYQMLAAYDPQNDTQILKQDQIIPESKFLGTVSSDHLTLALKFEQGTTPAFPRAALLESLVRVVLADLGAPAPAANQQKSWADGWVK
jgi:hypothetical protein